MGAFCSRRVESQRRGSTTIQQCIDQQRAVPTPPSRMGEQREEPPLVTRMDELRVAEPVHWASVECRANLMCVRPYRGASCNGCHRAAYQELFMNKHPVVCECCACVRIAQLLASRLPEMQ